MFVCVCVCVRVCVYVCVFACECERETEEREDIHTRLYVAVIIYASWSSTTIPSLPIHLPLCKYRYSKQRITPSLAEEGCMCACACVCVSVCVCV